MKYKYLLLTLLAFLLLSAPMRGQQKPAANYKESKEYLELRDSMLYAFNDGDSLRFFKHVKLFQNYLLEQDDLHAYYTQRCNEIVFLLNMQNIIEAYKLATQLSHELTERKLEKEMYMAVNMMGHIYYYTGNRESAKQCFWKVIRMMEKEGYQESMPPIYMNIVNIYMEEKSDSAEMLINKAIEVATKMAPQRLFDLETRRTLSYYERGEIDKFLEGYKAYQEGLKRGETSVHGRQLEVFYQSVMGNTDKAVEMAREVLGVTESYGSVAEIYTKAGRWKEAYEALEKRNSMNDSINSVILSSNMQGIQHELHAYEADKRATRQQLWLITAIALLLAVLVLALTYIVWSRRRHMKELRRAYDHALRADSMKSEFIRNVSHEVRTPLNLIQGFAQVIADPNLDASPEERKRMADTITANTSQITSLVDEILELANNESADDAMEKEDSVDVNALMRQLLKKAEEQKERGVELKLDTQLDDDCRIVTNELALARIVNALIDNSLKFTEQGSVTLLVSEQNNPSRLRVAVEDTGCGIPEEEREHIFSRFVKLDSFKEGLGLGLPLSRKMAERLGGTVTLDANYKKGARFVVELPL